MIKNNLHPWNLLSGSNWFLSVLVNLSWLLSVRNKWNWHAVTKIIKFRWDKVLKYVLCNTLTTAFNFATFGAWKSQRTSVNVQVQWRHYFFVCLHSSIGDDLWLCSWEPNKKVSPSDSFPGRWINKIVVLHKQKIVRYHFKRSNVQH